MTTKRTRTTRPLRSSPITGPSPLLRGGPSPCRASVLSPSQFQLLGVLPSAAGVNTPAGAITARGSHVSCQRPDRARATSVPGNRQGSKQVSPWLFPGQQLDPGYDCRRYAYDTSAVVHSRSPSRSPPDASRAPFPWCSSPRLIHRSNPRWFTASPCRAAAEGLPPSPAQHRNHQRDLLHRNLPSRSWRTIIGIAFERTTRELPGHPAIESKMHEQVRQDRRHRRSLRSSFVTLHKTAVWGLQRGSKPPLHIQQHPGGVTDSLYRLDDEIPRHRVEEFPDIQIDDSR